jgi:hypothetical protein
MMRKAIPLLIPILLLVAVLLFGCPSRTTPEEQIRATFAQGLEYIRSGEYEKVWTLYSHEFRRQIAREAEKAQAIVQARLKDGSDWINQWVEAQFGVTPQEFLKLSPREQDIRRNMVARDRILTQRIVGKIQVEGERATIKVQADDGTGPARLFFVLQDGRWLFDKRDFMPIDKGR